MAAGMVVKIAGNIDDLKRALDEGTLVIQRTMSAAEKLAPEAPDGGVGSLAGLVNQMFGRDPQAQQVEEIRRGNDLAKEQRDRLDRIIKKMDEQPPPIAFTNL
jgi:hypothetical protein